MSERDSFFDSQQQIVAVGGGHGLAATLEAITLEFPEANTYGLTTVVDSGSATGRLRNMAGAVGDMPYGLGDLRNNLARMSRNLGGELFGVRFDEHADPQLIQALYQDMTQAVKSRERPDDLTEAVMGDVIAYSELLSETEEGLRGHTYGNLVLAGLASRHGLWEGLEIANRWLDTKAHIQTLTTVPHHMHMWDDGEVYHTEDVIDSRRVTNPEKAQIWLDEGVTMVRGARRIVENADKLVFAAGSWWTSGSPIRAIDDFPDAVAVQAQRPCSSRIIVGNLVHEPNAGVIPIDTYKSRIEAEIGGKPCVMVHNTDIDRICPNEALYDRDGKLSAIDYGARLVSTQGLEEDPNDPLKGQRGTVLHDTSALGPAIRVAHQRAVVSV